MISLKHQIRYFTLRTFFSLFRLQGLTLRNLISYALSCEREKHLREREKTHNTNTIFDVCGVLCYYSIAHDVLGWLDFLLYVLSLSEHIRGVKEKISTAFFDTNPNRCILIIQMIQVHVCLLISLGLAIAWVFSCALRVFDMRK